MKPNASKIAGGLVIGMLVTCGGVWLHGARAAQPPPKPAIVFNITSGKEDLHAVTMALQLAGHALDDGREAVLFLNVRAPELARADLPESFAFGPNPPVKKMLADLLARGAQLIVCPHCMKALGMTEADLVNGAKVANRELLFGKLGPGTAVFSY